MIDQLHPSINHKLIETNKPLIDRSTAVTQKNEVYDL
jgi:hypothetical protein